MTTRKSVSLEPSLKGVLRELQMASERSAIERDRETYHLHDSPTVARRLGVPLERPLGDREYVVELQNGGD